MSIVKHLRSNLVAYLALFFALGGTSFAAAQALPRNSVGTKQLKRNAVNGAKVRNNSLTGADIRESSLGKVPSAVRADNATHANTADSAGSANSANSANSAANAANATNAANAANATNAGNANALQGHGPGDFVSSGSYHRVLFKLQAGDEQEIARNGPISIYARCIQETISGTNYDGIRMYAKTDVDGALLIANDGDELVGGANPATDFLNTDTLEANREVESSARVLTGQTEILGRYDYNHVIAPSGEAISLEGESKLLIFNYVGARCLIGGVIHYYNLS